MAKKADDDNELEPIVHPSVDNSFLIGTRRIFLVGEINEIVSTRIINLLQYFATHDKDLPVYLYISSEGGSLDAGYAIVDFIKLSPFIVHTIITGYAHSMAAMLAAYGTPGYRHMTKSSVAMLHNPWMALSPDNVNQQAVMTDFAKKDCDAKITDLARVMKKSPKELQDLLTKNLWMNSKTAIKHGLVDSVWTIEDEQKILTESNIVSSTDKDRLYQLGEILQALVDSIKQNQSWSKEKEND